jgi:hypothetical protein
MLILWGRPNDPPPVRLGLQQKVLTSLIIKGLIKNTVGMVDEMPRQVVLEGVPKDEYKVISFS